MKKQLRLVLFAVLVVLLVMTTALVASAATDGGATKEDGHYYSVVGPENGAAPKYYTTLAAAVESINANGYTVTVLGNGANGVNSEAWVLNSTYTYTITGGTEGATVTFTSHDATNKALINVSAGNVTVSNLTLVRGTDVSGTTAAVVYVSDVCTVTLDNVITSAAVTDTVYFNAAGTVTVSGADTDISGGTNSFAMVPADINAAKLKIEAGKITSNKYIMYLRADAVVEVTGGELTGDGILFYVYKFSPSITITNATVISGEGKAVFGGMLSPKPSITLGEGASITANNSTMFASLATGATLTLNGADLYLSGEEAKLHADSVPKVAITSAAGTVYLKDGAELPSDKLDKVGTANGFDWSVLFLQLASLTGSCEITTGEHTVTSMQEAQQLAKELFLAKYLKDFPKIDVAVTGSVAFVLKGENARLTVAAGEYVLDGVFVEVVAGTLVVNGGTLKGAANNTVISVKGGTVTLAGGVITAGEGGTVVVQEGGKLTVSGSTLTGATGKAVLDVKGGEVDLAGGTVNGGSNGSVALITGGVVNYISGTYVAGTDGVLFDAQGGTLNIDGAETLLSQHCYMLVAPGENVTPKYYTTLANAIAAINADGYTVTVLSEVTDTAWVLAVDYTYTVSGGAEGATVTFNSNDTSKGVLINVMAGAVTFENLTFVRGTEIVTTSVALVYVSGESDVTLHNVISEASVRDFVQAAAKANVTISGADTAISGFSRSFVNVVANDVCIEITGGTVTTATDVNLFYVSECTGVEIRVADATVTANGSLLLSVNASISLQLLEGTTVTLNNATAFIATEQTVDVVLNGATLKLNGENAILRAKTAETVRVTATAGTLELSADVPTLTTCLGDSAIAEDWSAIVFYLRNVIPVAELKAAGNYTFSSYEQMIETLRAQILANFRAEYGTRFPLAQALFPDELELPEGLIVNHPEAVVILSGTFSIDSGVLVTLRSGTVNITGGTFTLAGDAYLIDHQGGTLNITDGFFTGTIGVDSDLVRATASNENAPGTVNISGGNFKIRTVVHANSKVTVNVWGGQFAALTKEDQAYTLRISHAEARLFVTGGTFEDATRGVWAENGEISITGGRFYASTIKDTDSHIIYVNGPVKLSISGNPEFQVMLDNKYQHCVHVDSNSSQAQIDISGGTFGDLEKTKGYAYCVYVNAPVGEINITGGVFYGGLDAGSAIMVWSDGSGSVINISGSVEIYSYISVYVRAATTVNISGGSFNPHPGNADNVMLMLYSAATDSVFNVSGGTFSNYMKVFEVGAVSTINVSGGTFNERTVCSTKLNLVEAFAHIKAAATFNVLTNQNEAGPVINMGYSRFVNDEKVYEYIGVAFYIPADTGASINISAGTFNTQLPENKVFDVAEGSVERVVITGGTFYVEGDGAEFLPHELFDVEGNTHVLEGATLYLSWGACLPVYNYIDAYSLNLVVKGKYYIPGRLTVHVPYGGEDPNGDGYVISSMRDIEPILKAQFASFVANGTIGCATTFIPLAIDGEDVVVTLLNFTDVYNVDTFVRVTKGTLKVSGGTYNANAGERLFEILGNATVTITGGSYNVKGAQSYMLYVAEGVSFEGISVSGATIEIAEFGEIPLFADFDFNITADKLTVYGMSEILLSEAGRYEISSYESLTTYVTGVLSGKFTSNLTVDIKTWVPLRVDNVGAELIITGGDYHCVEDFMFAVKAGKITITGGKFTNIVGDIIRVLGPDVDITIDPSDDARIDMYTAGSIVAATDANKISVTVTGGNFIELAPDTTGNARRALFVLDASAAAQNAVLTIENGYFEATRMLFVNNVAATVTVNGGTFVSNNTVGTTVSVRATNAHMFTLIGADARLTINGGSFDNKEGNYIIAQLTVAGSATTINGGTFNGGSGWFYTDAATSLEINANADAAKNPVFTDTDAYGIETCGYFYLDHEGASLTVHAGSFTYGVSYEPIFRVNKGSLNIEDGTFKGYLFYMTEDSAITVNGGSYTASGAGAALVYMVGNVTRANFDIKIPLEIRVENNASFFETTLSKEAVLALLSNVSYVVSGNVRLSASMALTQNETWNTPADAQHFISEFFPEGTVTFEEAGVYSLNLTGPYTIVINGGSFSFYGATLLTLSGGADLVIIDGTFLVERGDVIFVTGAGSDIEIGDATNAETAPQFTVDGGSILHNDKVGSNVVIYNGSFVHGVYVNGSLKPTIDVTEPLFYFDTADSGNKSALTIHNGYFEATSVLVDNGGMVNTTIHNGVFKSNYIAQNMTSEHYGEDGKTPLAVELATREENKDFSYSLLYFSGKGQVLTIYGGSFDGGLGYAILGLYGTGGNTWTIAGGNFTGGYHWIYSDVALTLNIKNQKDEGGNVIAKPTFTASGSYLYCGIDLAASSTVNIEGGRFTISDKKDRYTFIFRKNTKVNITGGEFRITAGSSYDADEQLQNDSIVLYIQGTGVKMTIEGGTFQAARALICPKDAGATIDISGGSFTSNALSYDDSDMITIANDATVLNITGGLFTGNNYTKTILLFKSGKTGAMEANILGGTFKMSLRWIAVACPLTLNIGKIGAVGPTFEGLSDGKGADMKEGKETNVTAYGVQATSDAKDAIINFYSGTFKLDISQQYYIFHQVNARMTFYDDIVAESPLRVFNVTALIGTLHIKGGKYTSYDVGQLFYFSAKPTDEATVLIEGGEFYATGASELFNMGAANNVVLRIKGGKFFSEASRLIFLNGMDMQFIIEGGEFSTTAAHMINVNHNQTPLVIRGGTFTMLEKDGMNSDDALLYVAGKEYAVVNVEGGLFIDNRYNGKQIFFKYNPKAVVNMVGNFKIYSLELKDYFYYDYDENSNSLVMSGYTPTEDYGTDVYYTCFGYYNRYAPVITKAPVLRAMLGAEGITFTASVSAAVAQHLATLGTVSYGTLIFPTEYLGEDGWTNGTDFLKVLEAYADEMGMAYSSVYAIVNAVNGLVTEEDGSVTIRASIVNIKEKNYTRNLMGIAFAKVTDANGNETYYYASHVSAGVSANMRDVVKTAMNDLQSKPSEKNGRVYCYASIMQRNKFSRYTTVLQDSLRKYLPKEQRKPKF